MREQIRRLLEEGKSRATCHSPDRSLSGTTVSNSTPVASGSKVATPA